LLHLHRNPKQNHVPPLSRTTLFSLPYIYIRVFTCGAFLIDNLWTGLIYMKWLLLFVILQMARVHGWARTKGLAACTVLKTVN
ncbi:hypothetical protein LINGRAHAP2_LOCUS11517, partial [Linum grandiflorum]